MRSILNLVTIIVLGLMAACGQSSIADQEPGSNAEPDKPVTMPDTGEYYPDEVDKEPNINGRIDHKQIAEQTKYEEQTNQWFFGAGDGEIGWSTPAGKMPPESEINLYLHSHPVEKVTLERDVRVQLTSRDEDLQLLEMIAEKVIYIDEISAHDIYFSTQLPAEEGITYLFSVEILGENEKVEDTLLSLIEVPIQEMNAKLTTDQESYLSNETMTLTVKNEGPTSLFFGMAYTIEQWIDGAWVDVPLDLAFIEIALFLDPEETHEQEVDLDQLEPGLYRITKTISAEGTDQQEILHAEFQISE